MYTACGTPGTGDKAHGVASEPVWALPPHPRERERARERKQPVAVGGLPASHAQAQTRELPMPSGSKRSRPPVLRRASSGWAGAAPLTVRVTCTRPFVLSYMPEMKTCQLDTISSSCRDEDLQWGARRCVRA